MGSSREHAAHSTSQRNTSPGIFFKFTMQIHQLLAILVSVHKRTSRRKNNGLFKGCFFKGKHLMLERNNIHGLSKGLFAS